MRTVACLCLLLAAASCAALDDPLPPPAAECPDGSYDEGGVCLPERCAEQAAGDLAIVHVARDPACAETASCDGSPGAPFPDPGSAVEAALAAGADEVRLGPGEWVGAWTIRPGDLPLTFAGRCPELTTLRYELPAGAPPLDYPAPLEVGEADVASLAPVVLRGLALREGSVGLRVLAASVLVEDVEVAGVSAAGVVVGAGSGLTLRRVLVSDLDAPWPGPSGSGVLVLNSTLDAEELVIAEIDGDGVFAGRTVGSDAEVAVRISRSEIRDVRGHGCEDYAEDCAGKGVVAGSHAVVELDEVVLRRIEQVGLWTGQDSSLVGTVLTIDAEGIAPARGFEVSGGDLTLTESVIRGQGSGGGLVYPGNQLALTDVLVEDSAGFGLAAIGPDVLVELDLVSIVRTWQGAGGLGPIVQEEAPGVGMAGFGGVRFEASDLVVEDASAMGIYLLNSELRLEDGRIDRVHPVPGMAVAAGVVADNRSALTAERLTVRDVAGPGLAAQQVDAVQTGSQSNLLCVDCELIGNGFAGLLADGSQASLVRTTIRDTVEAPSVSGVYGVVHRSTWALILDEVTIGPHDHAGVYVEGDSRALIAGSSIDGADGSVRDAPWPRGNGVVAVDTRASPGGLVTGLRIEDTSIAEAGGGAILLHRASAGLDGLELRDNWRDLIQQACEDVGTVPPLGAEEAETHDDCLEARWLEPPRFVLLPAISAPEQ